MTQLTGRVFSRLQQYDALPTELKREVEALEKHLTATQREVFSSHPTLKLKTVHGVKTDALLEKIEAWYKQHGQEFSQTHSHGVGHGHGHSHGTAHGAAHNLKEDVKHTVGKDTAYDQTHGTGHGVTRDHHGTGHGVTGDHHHGTGHGVAHDVKQDVKHAMGRDHTYDPNYDQTQTRGYAGTATGTTHTTGAPTSATNSTGTAGTNAMTGTGAMNNATHGTDAATHQTTPSATNATAAGAHSTNPNVGNYQVAGSATPATAPVQPVQKSLIHGHMGVHNPHAKELLDALVLKGFVTPHKEPKPKLEDAGVATPSKPGAAAGAADPMNIGATKTGDLPKDLELTGSTLLVARAPSIADEKMKEKGPSVWDVVDGAVFAGMVKRKAGLIEKVIHGKETYVVVNERLHSLTLFKSDVSRKSITQLFNRGLQVAFDDSHAEHGQSHGVKVWNGADSELLFTTSQQERDALVRALVLIGASQNGVRGVQAATTEMKAKAEKVGHDVKKAVGADHHHHHHETHGHTTATHDPHHTGKHVSEGIMGTEHRGYHSPTTTSATRSATRTTTGDELHGEPGDRHPNVMKTTPDGSVQTQYQQQNHPHGMGKLGLGDHHQQQQQYQQNPQHGMTTDNTHVKRDVDESRGYAPVNEPTVAP